MLEHLEEARKPAGSEETPSTPIPAKPTSQPEKSKAVLLTDLAKSYYVEEYSPYENYYFQFYPYGI